VCSLVFVSSLAYPLTIYELFNSFVSHVSDPAKAEILKSKQGTLILWLVIYQTAFVLLVGIISIFQSHKIAGPIHKLHMFFQHVIDGNPPEFLFFRKGDHFQEIAQDFNLAFDKVHENHIKDLAYLSEVQSYINNLSLVVPDDKKPVIEEISRRLTEIQERFNEK
jgi:methyl-accepting chemotaxis protein